MFIKFTQMQKEIKELLKEISKLNNTDISVIESLSKSKTNNEIAQRVKKDRTIVQRSLKKLMRLNILDRRPECCKPNGGRYFIYSLKDKENILNQISEENERKYRETAKIIKKIKRREYVQHNIKQTRNKG